MDIIESTLSHTIENQIRLCKLSLQSLTHQLNTLNPLNTLERGYTITYNQHNKPITSIKETHTNESILIQYKDGILKALIEEKNIEKEL